MSVWTSGAAGVAAGYLLKTTAVLALALLATAAARKRPAALRHFILTAALIGLLLLPVATLAPAGWRAPLLPAWLAAPGATGTAPSAAPASPSVASLPVSAARSSSDIANVPDEGSTRATAAGVRGAEGEKVGTGYRVPHLGAALGAAARPLGLLIALAWAAGAAALLLRLAAGLSGAARLTRQGTTLDGPVWRALLARFLALLPLGRPVRLKTHPLVRVPLTWGWRRPVVLFPDGAGDWSDDERSAALCHELAHVKRADFLIMLLVRAGLALFWWNPLCWIVYRRSLKEQEIACDELVLRAGIRPSSYAASLLAFRRSAGLRWSPSAALPGLLGRSRFQERLATILKQKLTFMEVKMRTKITVALTLIAAVALVGAARPAAGHDDAASPASWVQAAGSRPAPEAPAPARTSVEPVAAQEAQKAQEKAKEAEKAKAAQKAEEAGKAAQERAAVEKKIVVKAKGDKSPIEITITRDGQEKTLVLDRSLTITKGEKGDVLVLTPDGKEPIVLEGRPLHIVIKGGALELLKEGHLLEPGLAAKIEAVQEPGEKGETVVHIGTGEPKMTWTAKVAEGRPLGQTVEVVGEGGKTVTYIFTPRARMAEGRAFAIAKDREGGAAWTVEGRPNQTVWIGGGDRDMLAKIQALQEQVQAIKAKKMDLAALEESLQKLEAELKAKEEQLKTFQYKFDKSAGPEHGVVVQGHKLAGVAAENEAEVLERVVEEEAAAEAAADAKRSEIKVQAKNDGPITMIFTGRTGSEGQKAYERAAARLKKDLHDGYKIAGQSYDPETGAIEFRVEAPKGVKADKAIVKKLVEIVRSEIDD